MAKSEFNPNVPPEWVSGSTTNDGSVRKFHRAVEEIRKQNKELKAQGREELPITEEAVKAKYVLYGGLVIGDEANTELGVDEATVRPARKRKVVAE